MNVGARPDGGLLGDDERLTQSDTSDSCPGTADDFGQTLIPARIKIDVPRLAVMARLDRAIALFIVLLPMARSSRAMTNWAAESQRQRRSDRRPTLALQPFPTGGPIELRRVVMPHVTDLPRAGVYQCDSSIGT